MIQIDRESDIPVHAQLVVQVKYLIANSTYRPGEFLPATRKLADKLDISFHTVRKAYATLSDHGLVESIRGTGYRVRDAAPLSKSDRMEKGAEVVANSLQQLIGLGLDDDEINYLIEEQRSLIETAHETYKILVAGLYREWSTAIAEHVSAAIQQDCTPIILDQLDRHADADFIFLPYGAIRDALTEVSNADLVGVQYELDDEALAAVARLLEHETLGLVTRYSDAIGPLTRELKSVTNFGGQVMAVSVEEGATHIPPLIRQCELILYTDGATRKMRPFFERMDRHAPLTINISPSTLDRIRGLVPA